MAHKRSIGLAGITNLSVLAPIKSGLAPGFEPISYLERLRKVLDALQSARQNLRESELRPAVFPDTIGRFGIIHHFRYAIIPPLPGADRKPIDGTLWHLSLNVTFDGGWEPYMRVIYRDIGPLLDLLFCHSPDYPGSRTSSFHEYCGWVRRNEIEGGLFYADTSLTLDDQHYLAEVEKAQREGPAADSDIARLSLPSAAARERRAMAKARTNPQGALVLPLRTLKGLYRLSTYFSTNGTGQGGNGDMVILRRFAQSVLHGPVVVMRQLDQLPETDPDAKTWTGAKKLFADELAWLQYGKVDEPVVMPDPLPVDPAKLQSHILSSGEAMTHGCVVLLRICDKGQALTTLATLADHCGPVIGEAGVGHLIAFTYAGMKELGIAQARLDALAAEFIDGMETRCALLGDVRGNHPDHWNRPLALGQTDGGQRVDLKTVHVSVLLRTTDNADPGYELHGKLASAVADLTKDGTGLRLLALEPTRSYRNKNGQVSGHFDFADGISQPQLPGTAGALPSDLVAAGELLLGHGNNRGDGPNSKLDPLQMDGSYLVMRKLRQRVDHLESAMAQVGSSKREEVLAKMMGRRRDGSPLVLPDGSPPSNDFDYGQPAASDACPFHSHIRRANPRDGRPYTPRILRRGMSYGPPPDTRPDAERGVVFMAYCASIAEQFETIQRWMAGGNSSGVGSAQGDPFLRVPQAGESSTFRYLDQEGAVVRVSFEAKPLVQLEWGLYLFVPALAALRALRDFLKAPEPASETKTQAPVAVDPEEAERESMRQILDDPDESKVEWRRVREGNSALQDKAYGHLIGKYDEVLLVMKDGGDNYSVGGYGDRMNESIGLNLLGIDRGPDTPQPALNAAVLAIGEKEAFDLTIEKVRQVLGKFPDLPAVNPGDAVRRPIDLLNFSDQVMAALCTAWIGLPEQSTKFPSPVMVPGGRLEANPGVPRCPGNFATVSRYIFSPHPRDDVKQAGRAQGRAVLGAVKYWLEFCPELGSLARKIKDGLGAAVPNETLALSLAGVLLGFPPTVQGNFIRTLETWIKDETLWQHQQALFDVAPAVELSYETADAALREVLFATMRKRPVPGMLWRSPVNNGKVDKEAKHRVVLGVASALTDDDAPKELMFGRDRDGAAMPTVHGCPGYHMAMGVLLAMIAGLMKAGTLRPTGSPVLLILTPSKSAQPSP